MNMIHKLESVPVVIDRLVNNFHDSVTRVSESPETFKMMIKCISDINRRFKPILLDTDNMKAIVLANVVGGIYAPLIHAFSGAVLRNIKSGVLASTVIAPPRDAIPLANSLKELSCVYGQRVDIYAPPVNRNTAGISNNQKELFLGRSPHFELLMDQVSTDLGQTSSVVEMETGIYGTTSKVMAEELILPPRFRTVT